MLFFTVVNWKLVPTPELLQVQELRAILDADRARTKETAVADLLYIYGMMQPKGPFSDFSITVRDRMVRKHCYGEVDAGPYETSMPVRWKRIIEGMRAYLRHNDNAEQRLLTELDESVDWVTQSLKNMRATPAADAKAIQGVIKSLKEVNSLLINKKEAAKLLEIGLEASKQKSKAGNTASPLERGLMKNVLGQRNSLAEEREDNNA